MKDNLGEQRRAGKERNTNYARIAFPFFGDHRISLLSPVESVENTTTMQSRDTTRLGEGPQGSKIVNLKKHFTGEGSFTTLSKLIKPSEKPLQPD